MAYNPPIGIPDPSIDFGFDINVATPGFPASWLTDPTTATTDFYYVDKTDPAATNTGNPYGHPDVPRLTPPEGLLAAGSYLYIHAGVYTSTDSGGDRFNWHGDGTSADPIWITGNPAAFPTFQDRIHFGLGATASFFVFENFNVNGSTSAVIEMRPTVDLTNIDHILIRNLVMEGTQAVSDGTAISAGISNGTGFSSTVSYVVVYDCEISNYGSKTSSDDCGIIAGPRSHHIWVLDNLIHDVAADSVAGSHYGNYTDQTTEYYYIGRNVLYGNGENGIDLKVIRYGVISQNVIYGPFAREQGGGIALHYGADSNFHCRDCAVIFNLIFHVSGGVGTGSSGVDNCFFIGNVFYDIRASYAVLPDVLNGFAISSTGTAVGSNSIQYFVNNTIYDYDRGLILEPNTGDQFICYGNIFSQRWTSSTLNDIEVENGKQSMVSLNYNLYDNPTTKILWANAVRNIAYMQGQGQELNAVEGDPDFINGPSANFNLLVGSPAINASVEGAAYAAYEAMFGVAIEVDYNNNPRPFGAAWDIGAFEFGAGPVPTPPDAPTDLTLVAVG
jgi:hypothetical protein